MWGFDGDYLFNLFVCLYLLSVGLFWFCFLMVLGFEPVPRTC
jgi:hypothetical protein